jgi:hypothetical protein
LSEGLLREREREKEREKIGREGREGGREEGRLMSKHHNVVLCSLHP